MKKCHPKKRPKQGSQTKPKTQSNQTQPKQTQSQQNKFVHRKCNGCGCDLHKNRACECPAWGQTCRKCGNLNHYEYVCHSQSSRSGQRTRRNNRSMVSEISRNNTPSLMSNSQNTVPKQVLDIVDMANSVDNLSQCYKKQLQLNTLTTNLMSSTQIFSNIKVNGILVRGKQDTGAEVNVMPLNVFDQLNLKLKWES